MLRTCARWILLFAIAMPFQAHSGQITSPTASPLPLIIPPIIESNATVDLDCPRTSELKQHYSEEMLLLLIGWTATVGVSIGGSLGAFLVWRCMLVHKSNSIEVV